MANVYEHHWVGTYFQLRCAKCGENIFAGADYCDSDKAHKFLVAAAERSDCPCPPGTLLDLQGQFSLAVLLEEKPEEDSDDAN